jgi:hypothetical protein
MEQTTTYDNDPLFSAMPSNIAYRIFSIMFIIGFSITKSLYFSGIMVILKNIPDIKYIGFIIIGINFFISGTLTEIEAKKIAKLNDNKNIDINDKNNKCTSFISTLYPKRLNINNNVKYVNTKTTISIIVREIMVSIGLTFLYTNKFKFDAGPFIPFVIIFVNVIHGNIPDNKNNGIGMPCIMPVLLKKLNINDIIIICDAGSIIAHIYENLLSMNLVCVSLIIRANITDLKTLIDDLFFIILF